MVMSCARCGSGKKDTKKTSATSTKKDKQTKK